MNMSMADADGDRKVDMDIMDGRIQIWNTNVKSYYLLQFLIAFAAVLLKSTNFLFTSASASTSICSSFNEEGRSLLSFLFMTFAFSFPLLFLFLHVVYFTFVSSSDQKSSPLSKVGWHTQTFFLWQIHKLTKYKAKAIYGLKFE
jgi:hypothetical protein